MKLKLVPLTAMNAFLNSTIICERAGQLHSRSLYPQAKSPPYLLNRRLNGCRSRSGRFGEGMNLLYLPSFELRTSSP